MKKLLLAALTLALLATASPAAASGACSDANGCLDWCVDGCHGILLTVAFRHGSGWASCSCTCVYLHGDGNWHEHNSNQFCWGSTTPRLQSWDYAGCDAPGYTVLMHDEMVGDYYTCCWDNDGVQECAEPWNGGGGEN